MIRSLGIAAALAGGLAGGAFAEDWVLVPEDSQVAFGSIKAGAQGETHRFTALSGQVGENGAAILEIRAASVDTAIGIRDERMRALVLEPERFPVAFVAGRIDMDALEGLAPGATAVIPAELSLGFLGATLPLTAELFVARLAEDRVLVATEGPVWLGTAELGIDAGVDALAEIAGLDSIARTVPVTARLVFERAE
jgi:hypothetical protein